MEWLRSNLSLAFPLADGAPADIAAVLADGWVASPITGQLTLDAFEPFALTNAHVLVKQGATVVLETTAATVTALGDFTMLEGVDTVRGSRYRFIVDPAAAALFGSLSYPCDLAGEACVLTGGRVTTLNGLAGDVRLVIDQHVGAALVDGRLVLTAAEPADRVDCTAVPCDQVFALAGSKPDSLGSAVITPDGCYRLVPHPVLPNTLLLYNHCTPCLECADIDELDAVFLNQSDYYHQLSAIYHEQFDRYQVAVAKANQDTEAQIDNGALVLPCGTVDIGARAFGRPYFSQLAVAIVNSSTYTLSVEVAVALTPTELSSVISGVDNSAIVQRYGPTVATQETHAGFPGTVTVLVGPGETVVVSSEVHLATTTDVVVGVWTTTATVTFTGGCDTLPTPTVVTRVSPVALGIAPPTEEP